MEVLEYNGIIHQLKCWSLESLAYECVCFHLPNKIMRDIDGIYRHIDRLIHRYLIDATTVSSKDIRLRPLVYNFDICSVCSNPRHVSCTDVYSAHNTIPTLHTPSMLYHYPIRF